MMASLHIADISWSLQTLAAPTHAVQECGCVPNGSYFAQGHPSEAMLYCGRRWAHAQPV